MEEEGQRGQLEGLGNISHRQCSQMLLATISIEKRREAEPAGKFLEDISEVVSIRASLGIGQTKVAVPTSRA